MSSLTPIEKKKLERSLGMESGYVLNFSNKTFARFFRDVVEVDIYASCYDKGSGSKANRMRSFWDRATDEQVSKLLKGLCENGELYSNGAIPDSVKNLCNEILVRICGVSEHSTCVQRPSSHSPIKRDTAARLNQHLVDISGHNPQQRGYAFEHFLNDMFGAYGLSPKSPFRLVGEQIDGSFDLNGEIYLLEAKWQNEQIGASDLHAFHGKLEQKASWSRGLFVSYSGFTLDGLQAFGRGKSLICMDGFDLSEMLRRGLPIAAVVNAKARHAAETGSPFQSVRDLIPE